SRFETSNRRESHDARYAGPARAHRARPDFLPGLRAPRHGELAERPAHVSLEVLQLLEGIRSHPGSRALSAPHVENPMMPRITLIVRAVAALIPLPALRPARAESAPSDPKATQIADDVMKALGGEERWKKLEGLRWSFESAVHDTVRSYRHHAWDMHTGW